jgi:hypothetical protein
MLVTKLQMFRIEVAGANRLQLTRMEYNHTDRQYYSIHCAMVCALRLASLGKKFRRRSCQFRCNLSLSTSASKAPHHVPYDVIDHPVWAYRATSSMPTYVIWKPSDPVVGASFTHHARMCFTDFDGGTSWRPKRFHAVSRFHK